MSVCAGYLTYGLPLHDAAARCAVTIVSGVILSVGLEVQSRTLFLRHMVEERAAKAHKQELPNGSSSRHSKNE